MPRLAFAPRILPEGAGSGMMARRAAARRRSPRNKLKKKGEELMEDFLAKERIIAGPGFNRWLVPPAALAIHLSIGQAYAFSVFKLPLTKVLGVTESVPGDWKQTELAWIFTIAIVFL